MCGIAGWIDWEADLTTQRPILEAMRDTLAQRGPDDAGIWTSRSAAFVHRRLVVIDPAGGTQPMVRRYGDRNYVIVYNGELYNTAELRQDLELAGHTFRGHSDTEVLLASYAQWGPSCVERFNGIFAFSIWDEYNQTLFMARDRLGVKPLFYTQNGGRFLFGSELKTLLAHPSVQPEIDLEGLSEIFIIGPARTPGHGVFRGVAELKPGHWLLLTRQKMQTAPYWTLISEPHTDDFDTTVEQVRFLLQDAITRQLVSDVPVCTMLSGGLDSSAISAFAAIALTDQRLGTLETYSVDYLDNDIHFHTNQFQPNSDAPYAKLMTEFLQSNHHKVEIDTPELVEALKTAVVARDLPGMTDVDSSLLLFCRAIKRDATVALSGECADEVFGGYPWFHREELVNAPTFPWSRMTHIRTGVLSKQLLAQMNADDYLAERYQQALAEVPALPGENAHDARMRELFYLNLTRWMPVLLDRKDRMSMAVGLEVRVPFCDHRIVDYVWNVPWSMKSCDGREKGLLRRALQGVLPDEIVARRKSPYPKTHNPAYLSACRNWLLEILDDRTSPLLPLVDEAAIRKLAQDSHTSVDLPWFGQLMNLPQLFAYLAQVDTWLRTYKVVIR
ncbi:MAG: hypothetical protein JWN30_1660 [Bacilli bacterium]|nr:hypothetical protein [Bacilli bacterium]